MSVRRFVVASAVAVSLLAGCRGGGSGAGAIPSLGPQAASPYAAAPSAALPGFAVVGPTHMYDNLPTSGKVNAFAYDPAKPNVLYVASGRGTGLETYSSAGIYRTRNGGASWQAIDRGLTDAQGRVSSVVNALWLDRTQPLVLLAATEYDGVFRSADGGTSWTNVFRTTQATQLVQYAGALYAATAAGILESTDNGKTWTVQFATSGNVRPAAFGAAEGTAGNALYAGMADGSIYALNAGTWSKRGKLPYDTHTGTDGSVPAVHQIAVDPLAPSVVYASSNDGRWDQDLHASVNGGRTWNTVLEKVYYRYGLGTQAIAFSLVHPHQLYIGADGFMYYIVGDGSAAPPAKQAANLSIIDLRNVWMAPTSTSGDDDCWIASDQGLDFVKACSTFTRTLTDRVVTASGATGLARRFTVSPNGRSLLVSLQDFSSHLTTDGGNTWHDNENLYEDGFNELRPGDPKACYAYDEASGLQTSNDGCVTFSQSHGMAAKLVPSRLMTTPIAFDPNDPLTMYVASGDVGGVGFPAAPRALFKTKDGGATFARMNSPMAQPGSIAVDARNGAHIVAGDLAQNRSGIYATFDGGKTWTKSKGVPATAFWYALTVSPADGNTVLASSVAANNDVFVLRSRDGGKSFARVSIVTNAPLLRGRVHPHERLRVGSGATGEDADADAATQPAAFIYSPEREIRYNQDAKRGVPAVVITTLRGAFLSGDDGATWRRLDDDLIAHSFWGIRWVKGYLYLASDGQGVVRSKRPLQ